VPTLHLHRACEALTALVREHVPEASSFGRVWQFAPGEAVWERGDPADALFLLERGAVEVVRGGARGVVIRRVQAGETFGELCMCREMGGKRASRAVAVADCAALRVSLDAFLAAARRSAALLDAAVGAMCDRLADAEARAEVLAERDAERRLAGLLLHLARTEGLARGEPVAALYLNQGQLARLAALSRSHTSVVLGRLRKRGLVDYAPNRPLRVDADALEELLDRAA